MNRKQTNFKRTKGSNLGECRDGNKSLVSCLPEVYPMYNIFFWKCRHMEMQCLAGALSLGCSCAGIKDCFMEGFSYL